MMPKKWIAGALAVLMLLSGCSKKQKDPEKSSVPSGETSSSSQQTGGKIPGKAEESSKPEVSEPEITVDPVLTALQEEITKNGALFGVAYLGYADLPGWEDVCVYLEAGGFADEFPFLTGIDEDHAVLHEGGEVYVVVPAGDDVRLTVSDYVMDESNDYIPDRGEDLLETEDGKPLVLRGNVSEIVPNLLITAESGFEAFEYNPCLSGMDGTLVAEGGIYDFTPYELLMGGYDPVPDEAFTLNTWYSQYYDGDGNLWAMTLDLAPDGSAEYTYGWPFSGNVERYEGQWISDGGTGLRLEMTGGMIDDMGEYIPGEQGEFISELTWDMESSGLSLHHEGGDPLLYGTEDCWYPFMSFNGWHLVNLWTSDEAFHGWRYKLQLFDTEECIFSIHEADGAELVSYEGWWYYSDDGQLSLNMMLSSGEHPENPELEFFSGGYQLDGWDPYNMTLSYLSGEILTLEMEETGSASFAGY